MRACKTLVKKLFNPGWLYTIFPDQSMLITIPYYSGDKCLSIHSVEMHPKYNRENLSWMINTPIAYLEQIGCDASFFLSGKMMVHVNSLTNYIDNKDELDRRITEAIEQLGL